LSSRDQGFGENDAARIPREDAIKGASAESLAAAVADPALSEDLALAFLKQADLPSEVLEKLSKNRVASSRKVKVAILEHARTPRHVSLALVRQLFTFDLMRVALMPTVAGDIKIAAEEVLIRKLESIPCGERLSLARRASARVAAALLLDSEPRVMRTALENARLTEAVVVRTVSGAGTPAALARAVSEHPKWSLRREIRVALLRSAKTPIERAVEFARTIPPVQVREILRSSRLPGITQAAILEELAKRTRQDKTC
jgi:hypothetical protein